jgi:2-phosphoglycerate kinase
VTNEPKPLSDDDQNVLARELVSERLEVTRPVEQPTAILTAGQPGAGNSIIVERLSVSFAKAGGAPIVIDPDRIRPQLPYMIDRDLSGDLHTPDAANVDA